MASGTSATPAFYGITSNFCPFFPSAKPNKAAGGRSELLEIASCRGDGDFLSLHKQCFFEADSPAAQGISNSAFLTLASSWRSSRVSILPVISAFLSEPVPFSILVAAFNLQNPRRSISDSISRHRLRLRNIALIVYNTILDMIWVIRNVQCHCQNPLPNVELHCDPLVLSCKI